MNGCFPHADYRDIGCNSLIAGCEQPGRNPSFPTSYSFQEVVSEDEHADQYENVVVFIIDHEPDRENCAEDNGLLQPSFS